MFPPTNRCVMMWGFSRPESSVWIWYCFPLCLMLWLKPVTSLDTPFDLAGRESTSEPGRAHEPCRPSTRGVPPRPPLHVDVLGELDRAAQEAPGDGREPLGLASEEEPL